MEPAAITVMSVMETTAEIASQSTANILSWLGEYLDAIRDIDEFFEALKTHRRELEAAFSKTRLTFVLQAFQGRSREGRLSLEGLAETASEVYAWLEHWPRDVGEPTIRQCALISLLLLRREADHALKTPKYRAFISYKHDKSTTFAERFEKAVKSYGRGWFKRPLAVFRDEKLLKPGDSLPDGIADGLKKSEYLILLASKEATDSTWVRDELWKWCAQLGRADRLIVVLTGGSITVRGKRIDWDETNALPRELSAFLVDLRLHVDLRDVPASDWDLQNIRFSSAVNQIAATLNCCTPEEMNDEAVRTYRRNRRIRAGAIGLLCGLLALAVGLEIWGEHLRKKGFIFDESISFSSRKFPDQAGFRTGTNYRALLRRAPHHQGRAEMWHRHCSVAAYLAR